MEGEIIRTRKRRALSHLDAGDEVIERPCAKLQASPCEQMPSAEYSRQNLENATKSDQRCADLQRRRRHVLHLVQRILLFPVEGDFGLLGDLRSGYNQGA